MLSAGSCVLGPYSRLGSRTCGVGLSVLAVGVPDLGSNSISARLNLICTDSPNSGRRMLQMQSESATGDSLSPVHGFGTLTLSAELRQLDIELVTFRPLIKPI